MGGLMGGSVGGSAGAKWKRARGCLEEPVCDDSEGAVGGSVAGLLGGSVGRSVGSSVGSSVGAAVCGSVAGLLGGSVDRSVVGAAVGGSMGDIGASSLAVSSAVKGEEAEKEGNESNGNKNDEGEGEERVGSGKQQQQHQQQQLLYEFLWEDRILEEAAAASGTYQLLRLEMRRMKKNPQLTDREFVRQVWMVAVAGSHIKQLCVMIEEHIGELTGRFELNHGAYFRDPRILAVISLPGKHRAHTQCLPFLLCPLLSPSVLQIKQLCVMIEEHIGELTGRFDLNHGAYFRDPRILAVIAHFLQHWALPD
ncbi:unnamed protein product [Closterium sp. NIES-54]